MKRSTVIATWISAALVAGAIGGLSGSAIPVRVANGTFAAGFGYLAWEALARSRTFTALIHGLLLALFVFFAVLPSITAPVYELLATIMDEL